MPDLSEDSEEFEGADVSEISGPNQPPATALASDLWRGCPLGLQPSATRPATQTAEKL